MKRLILDKRQTKDYREMLYTTETGMQLICRTTGKEVKLADRWVLEWVDEDGEYYYGLEFED